MADWNWANGRLTQVVHPVGKFANGDARYRRARFDILKWNISGTEETYILAPTADRQTESAEAIRSAIQEHESGTQFGFYTNETLIIDIKGHHDADTLPALHAFGYV